MRVVHLFSAALIGVLVSCTSDVDSVCESVGDCSQAGSTPWIENCKNQSKMLGKEASKVGCIRPFDDYFSCANSNFDCQGATSVFVGCDDKRMALDACFDNVEAITACAALTMAESACTEAQVMTSTAMARPACTHLRDCEAQCYMAQVSNACAPRVDELDAFAGCQSSCVP